MKAEILDYESVKIKPSTQKLLHTSKNISPKYENR